jgi:TonB-dependent SusC/RagA subfamily outer membrane receptor
MPFPLFAIIIAFLIPVANFAQAVSPISVRIIQLNYSVDSIISLIRSSNDNYSAPEQHIPADTRHGGTVCAPTPLKNRNNPLVILNGRAIPNRKLQNLNSGDIENIFVVKGEEAISKYGSSGENGVLVITTKRVNINKKARLN